VCCAPALAVEIGIGYREVWRFCAHPEQVARNITSMRVMLWGVRATGVGVRAWSPIGGAVGAAVWALVQ
jgi:hypothetical protein